VNAVEKIEPRAVAAVTPMDMLNRAVEIRRRLRDGREADEPARALGNRPSPQGFRQGHRAAKAKITPIQRNANRPQLDKKYADFAQSPRWLTRS
jgi:hypothetical protein